MQELRRSKYTNSKQANTQAADLNVCSIDDTLFVSLLLFHSGCIVRCDEKIAFFSYECVCVFSLSISIYSYFSCQLSKCLSLRWKARMFPTDPNQPENTLVLSELKLVKIPYDTCIFSILFVIKERKFYSVYVVKKSKNLYLQKQIPYVCCCCVN